MHQTAFLGHDAGHRQIARSRRVNDVIGRPARPPPVQVRPAETALLAVHYVAYLTAGGLSHQIEHHLFPSMPRPSLRRAQGAVRAFCAERDIPHAEAGRLVSYAQVLRHLDRTGRPGRESGRESGLGRGLSTW